MGKLTDFANRLCVAHQFISYFVAPFGVSENFSESSLT